MSITDELREWLENAYNYGTGEDLFKKNFRPWFGWKAVLEPMLDRIDAEHESKVSYWQGASYEYGYDEGFASADDWLAQHEDAMAEHGWVKLPVDADGVPIRVGDEMVYPNLSGHPVRFITLNENGWGVNERNWVPSMLFHRRPLTVEDVLREFLAAYDKADEGQLGVKVDDVFTEYAAKLRLAGDGE